MSASSPRLPAGIESDYPFKPSGSMTGWTVVGQEERGNAQRVLVNYNPLVGTSHQAVEEGIPAEVILTTQEEAEILADKLMVMDEVYWPPFNPIVARIEDGRVVRLVPPPSSGAA